MVSVPYAGSRSGANARNEIRSILQRFGVSSVGFMEHFDSHKLTVAFEWRDRKVQLEASAAGWAALFLERNPWNSRRKVSEEEWREKALNQGLVAVNSILRDWIKGQITAVETGILQFDSVFFPYLLTPAGDTLHERIEESGVRGLLEGDS